MSVKRGVAVRQDDPWTGHEGEAPKLRLVQGVPQGDDATAPSRPCRMADRLIGACSLVSTAPLLDVRKFGWTRAMRERWQAVRAEAGDGGTEISPHRHPETAAIVANIPELLSARFEALPPGAHPPRRHLASRALLTCHLGLTVPRAGDLRMRLGGRMVRWAEGETLLFDATRAQGWFNDGGEAGLVLSVELRRPLRQPGRWIADALLRQAGGAALARTTSR